MKIMESNFEPQKGLIAVYSISQGLKEIGLQVDYGSDKAALLDLLIAHVCLSRLCPNLFLPVMIDKVKDENYSSSLFGCFTLQGFEQAPLFVADTIHRLIPHEIGEQHHLVTASLKATLALAVRNLHQALFEICKRLIR